MLKIYWYLLLKTYLRTKKIEYINGKKNSANILTRNLDQVCYESKLKGLSNDTTLVLSDTRELDRVPSTK